MKRSLSINFLLTACLLLINSDLFAQIGANIMGQATSVVARRTDTVVYKANAYVIQPNDKLDDLLARLPGITIDSRGSVYEQGEKLQRLLVDGNEFFSDDPLSAAHVLRADKVDKIMIYWRWSDQAAFTGTEDAIKIKTINVILKK
jgi:hypothetical protein